ncbi:MAG: DHH family phosphoesterase [Thermoplasmata archaeon]|nr:DHH family phosphoesterase [Thermoplasmata archaeon]
MSLPVEEAAARLAGQESVHIVAHIDADGIAAAAVADAALERAGIDHTVQFVKQMEGAIVGALPDTFLWFVDLGSGSLDVLGDRRFLITDHHPPSGAWPPVDRTRGAGLDAFLPPDDRFMINPHLHGLDGATDVSGAGVAYLIAKRLDPRNADLAAIAVIGAVGDLQDSRDNRLVGINRAILGDAVGNGDIEVVTDVRLFGRETRPVQKFLAYADDPDIPGIRNDPGAALELIRAAGVPPRRDGEWRPWSSLDAAERRKVFSAVTKRMLLHGRTGEDVRRLVGEVYLLRREAPGTPFREAKEFATVLNSCGRYDRAVVGLRLLRGDVEARAKALDLLQAHRRNLVDALRTVENEVVTRGVLQFFDGGAAVRDTLVGIVAGMLLSSGNADPGLPIFGFAAAEDSEGRRMLKVSARMERSLRGSVDLDLVVRQASAAVDGFGGGHDVAAGGAIPDGRRDEFLAEADRILRGMRENGG